MRTAQRHRRGTRRIAVGITTVLVAAMVLPLSGCTNLSNGTVLKVIAIALDRHYGSRLDRQEAAGDHLRVLADKSEALRKGMFSVINLAVQATNPSDPKAQENFWLDAREGTCEVALPGLGKDYARPGPPSPYGVGWTASALPLPISGSFTGRLTCTINHPASSPPGEVSADFTVEVLPFWQEGQLDYSAHVGQPVTGMLHVASTGVPQPNPPVFWTLGGIGNGAVPPPGFSLDSPDCSYDSMGAAHGAIANNPDAANSCDIEVTFLPTDVGRTTTQLSVPYEWYRCRVVPSQTCPGTDLTSGRGTLTFNLTGTGTGTDTASPTPTQAASAPGFTATPNPVAFGVRPTVASTPPALPVTVTNPGTASLVVTGVTVAPAGDFTIADDQCSNVPVTPTGNCQLLINFNPTSPGEKAANLVFTTNAGTQQVPLTGTATQAGFLPDATTLDFFGSPVLPSPGQTVTVTNTGDGGLTYGASGVQLGGDDPAQFEVTANTCSGATIAPAGTCTVTVRFAPDDEGTMGATLEFFDNAPPFLHTITLNGVSLAG